MEKTGCEVICGALTTPAVEGQVKVTVTEIGLGGKSLTVGTERFQTALVQTRHCLPRFRVNSMH